jgi:hypothetical protein
MDDEQSTLVVLSDLKKLCAPIHVLVRDGMSKTESAVVD